MMSNDVALTSVVFDQLSPFIQALIAHWTNDMVVLSSLLNIADYSELALPRKTTGVYCIY